MGTARGGKRASVGAPRGFRVARELPLGRHPMLTAFPGLDRLPTAARQEPAAARRAQLFRSSFVELVADDVWMYVAPWVDIRYGRWHPVVAPKTDVIVVGEKHFRESPELVLFLDIFHELCHLRQRHRGEELFNRPESYVRRPTELEAYRFAIGEARRLRVADEVLRDYLRVEWIDEREYRELLGAVGVPVE